MLALMISFLICLFICTDHQVLLDCGAVQADALTVDRLASLEKVYEFHLFHTPALFIYLSAWLLIVIITILCFSSG